MIIKRLEAHQIKGFEDFAMDPGGVTVVSGANASNKTSLLALVTGLFGKGNPRMLRAGAESGHVRAILEGENETLEVRRDFTPGKVKTPIVKSNKAGKLGAGVEYLASLMDPISVDPINRAMNASEEDQTRILLDTIPMELDPQSLDAAIAGLSPLKLPNLAPLAKAATQQPALDGLKSVEDYIYNERTNVNRDEKLKKAHAGQLLAALPPEVDGSSDWESTVAAYDAEITRWVAEERNKLIYEGERHSDEKAKSVQMAVDAKESIDYEVNQKIDVLKQQIAELESQRNVDKAKVSDILAGEMERLSQEHAVATKQISDHYRPLHADLDAKKAVAVEHASNQTRITEVKRIAASAKAEAEALNAKSRLMSSALIEIDKVRVTLLDKLPIKGLSIQGGIVYLDGVPLSERNTAERARFWIRVAARRAGELGVICMDGAECFDEAHFADVVDGMRRTGLQWFIARVTSGDFKVETFSSLVDEEEAA